MADVTANLFRGYDRLVYASLYRVFPKGNRQGQAGGSRPKRYRYCVSSSQGGEHHAKYQNNARYDRCQGCLVSLPFTPVMSC